jgi:hypothetical protein
MRQQAKYVATSSQTATSFLWSNVVIVSILDSLTTALQSPSLLMIGWMTRTQRSRFPIVALWRFSNKRPGRHLPPSGTRFRVEISFSAEVSRLYYALGQVGEHEVVVACGFADPPPFQS